MKSPHKKTPLVVDDTRLQIGVKRVILCNLNNGVLKSSDPPEFIRFCEQQSLDDISTRYQSDPVFSSFLDQYL